MPEMSGMYCCWLPDFLRDIQGNSGNALQRLYTDPIIHINYLEKLCLISKVPSTCLKIPDFCESAFHLLCES